MKHFMIRHPAVTTSGLCIGQTDILLSAEGRASIPDLVEVVRSVAPGFIISSDLQRCSDLGYELGTRLGIPVHLDPRWREINFGAWENRSWDEIHETDQAGFDRWAINFQHESPPGGEMFVDFLNRILAATENLPIEDVAVVVTHAGCIRAVACLLKLVSPEQMFNLDIPYGSVFELDLKNKGLNPPENGACPKMNLSIHFILGGIRSGKSRYAETVAETVSQKKNSRVVYVATCATNIADHEMENRLAKHRNRRPEQWLTIENRFDLKSIFQEFRESLILLDCLTLWLSYRQMQERSEDVILSELEDALGSISPESPGLIVVSSEVGLSLVSASAEGRSFCDLTGSANQLMARLSSRVDFIVAGLPMLLKGDRI